MEKILLCGNGINIKFNKKFQLNEFVEILKNEEKLWETIDIIISMPSYKKWNNFVTEFVKIVKRCKNELNKLSSNALQNGVEIAIETFFNSVDTFMRLRDLNRIKYTYDNFKNFFKILFFNYIQRMALGQARKIRVTEYSIGFKNKLTNYLIIYTLNYDIILEEFLDDENFNSQDIIHLHGKMFYDQEKRILNHEKCTINENQNSKSNSLPKIPLTFDYNLKEKQKLELDIIGLNPINDENILALFINSKACKIINFYYHTDNDLKNLEIALDKIKNFWIISNDNNFELETYGPKFIYDNKIKNKYILYFSPNYQTFSINPDIKKSNGILEINLIPSSKFWDECKNIKNKNQAVNINIQP